MNLKYYLRGLGLGIVMAAIVLGITASGKKAALTKEEIVAKAKDFGMVEEEELKKQLEDARAETEQRVKEEAMAEYSAAHEESSSMEAGDSGLDAQGMEDGQAEESEQEETPEKEDGQAGESEQEETPEEEAGQAGESEQEETLEKEDGSEGNEADEEKQTVFIVKKGESPYSIGKRMEEEGLLPKDAGFDRYLVDHGFDTKVVAAEYVIPADADMETIAKIITKQIFPN